MAGKTQIEPALIELYILGLTTEEECREVEFYLAQNPAVAKEVRDSQSTIEDFAKEYVIEAPKKSNENFLKSIKSLFRR